MLDINVVYIYLDPADTYALRRGDVRITWSPSPLPDCDLYAYTSAASFFGRRSGPQVLIQAEPVVTQPREFTAEVYGHFDHVLTMLDALNDVAPWISRWQPPPWDLRDHPGGMPDLATLRELYPRDGRRDAICMINGNKTSTVPGQLYSARAEIARWFNDRSDIPFDVYGMPPFPDLPNFVRSLSPDEKLSVLSSYRYRLCLENCYDPFWSRGYISEKLPESLACGVVPIYYGCANIEEYLPANCFIDYRELGSPKRLEEYLRDTTDADYHATVDAIDDWLGAGNLRDYCQSRLYDKLTELLATAIDGTALRMWGDDAEWIPAEIAAAPPKRALDHPAWQEANALPYWTWDYLTRATLDDCNASVDAMRNSGVLAPDSRCVSTRRVEKRRDIRRVLYLGVRKCYGEHPNEDDYNARNLLMDWNAWPDVEVEHIDPGARAMALGTAGMSEEILECVVEQEFDLVFCVPYDRSLDVLHDTMRRITRHTNTMVWLPYTPDMFDTHSLPWAECADRVVTTSSDDLRAFAKAGYADRALGSRWAFSPQTYNRRPGGGRVAREPVVTLVGPRSDLSVHVCDRLSSHGVEVAAYGRGWGKDRFLGTERFHRTFGESAINLNLSGRRRVFETTGSGGFLLTAPVEGLADAFITDAADANRAEVAVANNADELLYKVRHYLDRPRERAAIARRGYQRAHARHTWAHRLADVCTRAGWTLPDPTA